MKKKPLYLLLSVVLMISLFPFTIQAEEFTSGSDALPDIIPNGVFSWEGDQAEKDSEVSVSMRELPFYIGSLEVTFDLPVYYVNGTDIPYMNLENWADVMVTLMQEGMGDMEYGLFIETDEELAQVADLLRIKKIETLDNFANAREVRNLFEKIITNQARRLDAMENPGVEDMRTLIYEDLFDEEAPEHSPIPDGRPSDPEPEA